MAENVYEKEPNQEKRFTSHHVKLIFLLIFALLLVIFAIQNAQEVVIRLWFWNFRASMALALIICMVAGFLLSFLYFLPLLRSKDKIIRGKEREIAKLRVNSPRKPPEQKKYPDYL